MWRCGRSLTVLPVQLEQGHSFVEADLEQWVERDATLVLDGLTWIGRQVTLPDRSRVDLVGLTREGSSWWRN